MQEACQLCHLGHNKIVSTKGDLGQFY
uniref:Uncharacterized protein n=1 Tax=Anguilla anguilla TaxID=7936 RepID=A0A0E9VXJ1_ANGAN